MAARRKPSGSRKPWGKGTVVRDQQPGRAELSHQAGFHCQLQAFLGGKDTDHISIRIDHADWSDPDLIIDPMHLFRRCRR